MELSQVFFGGLLITALFALARMLGGSRHRFETRLDTDLTTAALIQLAETMRRQAEQQEREHGSGAAGLFIFVVLAFLIFLASQGSGTGWFP